MKYTVLCEDAQSACFIRHFLKERNVKRHDIREEIAPAGQGCGEQWVREHYSTELEANRKSTRNLIVCIDADNLPVRQRIQALNDECKTQNVPVRTQKDTAALFIPKRNIETWIEFLHRRTVNEATNYAKPVHRANKNKCETAAKNLDTDCTGLRQSPPKPPALPFPLSLRTACADAKRVSL